MPEIKQDATTDPLWFKDAVIYQVHIKSFFDSNADGYGDFPGLIEKLDYIQALGADCIWLLPFYPSPLRDDGYDIADYEEINPVYGKREDFKTFIEEAHRRGIRVITELIVNHTSDQHPWFQASRLAPAGSNKRNYYVWSDTDTKYPDVRIIFCDTEKSNWTWDPVANAYYWHRFFYHQPDLNFDNPSVMKAIIRVMRFWLDLGVDAMRLDAIPYLIERDGTNCENLPETHAILKEFRRVMDENYDGRVFLAEANQWPSEVVQYFGDGDECQMAFHFPVMPRLYMAIHQEDRHPITEIMAQTPPIPENCQWAMFLRNHDELTLEMVTDEERDYMYKAYAHDPQMRINVGIRRRLAPLMQHSRPRIELMNAMLLSLPGTPIIYYGDEIGMGENIFLGDRNGVRTPMQWNSDRNAGFSRAPFAKLYSAPIMDPVTGYPAVNVESQELDPSSLLNWMRTIIGLRKKYKVFGRGTFEPVESDNRKVLSYLRRFENETILMVANLSRYPQSVSLNLREFDGVHPTELLGLGQFHAIGSDPYIVTLGPYSFYWLGINLPQKSVPITAPQKAAETKTHEQQQQMREAVLTVRANRREDWQALMTSQLRWKLEGYVLPAYLKKQRWFGGKAKTIESVVIKDWVSVTESPELTSIVFAEVDYDDETKEVYTLFFAVAEGDHAVEMLAKNPDYVIAELAGEGEEHALIYDALESEAFCLALLKLIQGNDKRKTQTGDLISAKTPEFESLVKEADQQPFAVKRIRTEQSNSSVIFGTSYILKLFRNLHPGKNPDYELGRYLTEVRHFKNVAQIAGVIEYAEPGTAEKYVAGLLQEMVWNQGDAWTYTVEEFRRFYERALTHMYVVDKVDPGQARIVDLIDKDIPQEAYELLAIYLREASILGKRTAEMHIALSQDTDDAAIRPEPMTKADLKALKDEMHADVDVILAQLKAKQSTLPPDMVEASEELLRFRPNVLDIIDSIDNVKTQLLKMRCHGDYHLGQVLYRAGDFVILDFEGEPAKPLPLRQRKLSPMKDVAGMVRSFSYAAWAGLFLFVHNRPEDLERFIPWAKICQTWVSVSFLKGYLETAAGHDFIPSSKPDFFHALLPFIMDKAMYEVKYELNNRPDWLKVPVSGILQYLRANTLNSEAASPK
jgi:maltose alpha-D-glucosyltransferase / alpha-amylase